jgi:Fe-S cluster assembly iron-binding protein IscA
LPEPVCLCNVLSIRPYASFAYDSEIGFNNVGLYVRRQSNVIIRNLKISYVVAANGDAITVDVSKPDAGHRTV